jgi:hypothetical protein
MPTKKPTSGGANITAIKNFQYVHDPPLHITHEQKEQLKPRGDGYPRGTAKQPGAILN